MARLDSKLTAIAEGRYHPRDFILADAKDGDMAWGATAGGPAEPGADGQPRWKTRAQHLDAMRAVIGHGAIDILLASAANGEELARSGAFAGTGVTLAIRANDATDIWNPRFSNYANQPSRPFRSASLQEVQRFCDLGLYSMTFNNDLDHDQASLEAYGAFRAEAKALHFRHFLEVFNPNAPQGLAPDQVGPFVNDCILRALAGVTRAERPRFLKIAFNGARWLDELVTHDPSLIVGILGGSAGTTRDTYELLHQGERWGARIALFGRKINLAESPLDLLGLMRPVLERTVTPAEAVRAYHAALAKAGVKAKRALEADLEVTEPALREG